MRYAADVKNVVGKVDIWIPYRCPVRTDSMGKSSGLIKTY